MDCNYPPSFEHESYLRFQARLISIWVIMMIHYSRVHCVTFDLQLCMDCT